MTPPEILSRPPQVLSQSQRESYFEQGYLCVPAFNDETWTARLRGAMQSLIEASRSLTRSNDTYILENGHCAASPRLRRLNSPVDHEPAFWEYAAESALPDLVAALIGPDVKFRECVLNFKWASGGQAVKWHQDFAFYPHSNLSVPVAITFLEDVAADQGPLRVIPRSHTGGIYDHFDTRGAWAGAISDDDLRSVALENAVDVTGPAGTVVVVHPATIHGSRSNGSARGRPLLINEYAAADARAYAPTPIPSRYTERTVRGHAAVDVHVEDIDVRMPPDWSGGYVSIFEAQAGEVTPADG